MDLIAVIEKFPDQEACIEHLEAIRWGDTPQCPKCEGFAIVRKSESGLGRIGRWCCSDCGASFKVTSGYHVCWDEDTASEVVSGYLVDGKRQEESLKLSTCQRFRIAAESSMVSNDEDTCRDGGKFIALNGHC